MQEQLKQFFLSSEIPTYRKGKQRGSWESKEINPVFPVSRQKFPRYFEVHPEFFAVF
jgi:hypothetical protein